MNEPRFRTEDGAFDARAFATHVEQRLAERPELRRTAALAGGLSLTLIVLGLVGLWRWRRRPHTPAGLAAEPGWGLGLPILLLFAIPGTGLVAMRALGAAGLPDDDPTRLLAGAIGLALLAALGLAAAATRPGGLAPLGLQRPGRLRAAGAGLVAFIFALPLVSAAQFLTAALFQIAGQAPAPNPAAVLYLTTDDPRSLALVWAIAAGLAPVAEETIFRGLLYPAARKRLGPRRAAVLSAALFALVHPPADMPAIFVLGLALALVYEYTGSLLAPIACHLANNLYGMAGLALQRHLALP